MKKFDPVSVFGIAICVVMMIAGGYYSSRQARIAAAAQAERARIAAEAQLKAAADAPAQAADAITEDS